MTYAEKDFEIQKIHLMKIKKGSRRIVFIFPSLGFVIKIPKILLFRVLQHITIDIWGGHKKYLKKWFKYSVDTWGGFKNLAYKGIHDNWHEYKFYSSNHNTFLQPTYFSLYGLLNIQKYGKQIKMNGQILLPYFMNLTENEAWKDNHHFFASKNFCFDGSNIKILDYGSKKTQKIISKWGEKIVKEFDLEKVLVDD